MDNAQTLQNQQMLQEDEIDLRELGRTIANYKWSILFFVFFITSASAVYTLSKPNEYESKTLLMPQENAKPSLGGGLAALAGMAGVDIGSSGTPGTEESFNALLNNYNFMKSFILKYDLHNRLGSDESQKNYKFALGYDGIYKFLKGEKKEATKQENEEEKIFNTYKSLSGIITIVAEKKSGIITMSAKNSDSAMAKELVENFLGYASSYLKQKDMSDNDKKISYYDDAMKKTSDISLKVKLAELESALIQKKVLSDANEFYNVKQFTKPEVAFIKDKIGPKRGLIVVVSAVTSLILSIFGVFLVEFIKGKKEEE